MRVPYVSCISYYDTYIYTFILMTYYYIYLTCIYICIQVYSARSPTACPCPARSHTACLTKPALSPLTRSVSCDEYIYYSVYEHTTVYVVLYYNCIFIIYVILTRIYTHLHLYYTHTML